MTEKLAANKTHRRNSFTWVSDATLRMAGFREWQGIAGQPIPPQYAAKSVVLMSVCGFLIGFLFLSLFYHFVALQRLLGFSELLVCLIVGVCSLLLAGLQAMRIARLNRATQRHRIGVLERTANKELAIW